MFLILLPYIIGRFKKTFSGPLLTKTLDEKKMLEKYYLPLFILYRN